MLRHRSSHAASTVSLRLRHLGQLFNSFDPSPFRDRDLDRDAAAFVEEEFSDRPRDRTGVLNISTADHHDYTHADVQEALNHYYARLADSTRHRIREQLRIGRISLAVGFGVFMLCMGGRGLFESTQAAPLPRVLDEGLIVLAWIALWLPIEQLVSDLIPLIRQRAFYQRLARIRVHLHRTPVDVAAERERATHPSGVAASPP
jgi:hypothetical protein